MGPEPPVRTSAAPSSLSVLVRLNGQLFAFPAVNVREMTSVVDVTRLPDSPPDVSGLLNLRGQPLLLIDLRARLGMKSAAAELDELLEIFIARENDHRRWIVELEACLRENREFTLATDPHRCAFGRWYDALTTDSIVLATQLRKIDGPHQRIHRRGLEAIEASRAGERERALAIAHEIRTNELAVTLDLFEETRRLLRESRREMAVVLDVAGERIAAAVDAVEAVERLRTTDAASAGRTMGAGPSLVSAVRLRARDDSMVLLIDPERLLAA